MHAIVTYQYNDLEYAAPCVLNLQRLGLWCHDDCFVELELLQCHVSELVALQQTCHGCVGIAVFVDASAGAALLLDLFTDPGNSDLFVLISAVLRLLG